MIIGISFVVIIVLPAMFAPADQPKYFAPFATASFIGSIKFSL